MEYVLAIDGGGTKTTVVCATLDGTEVGQGNSGPTSLTATNVGAASFNLREGIRQALEKCDPKQTTIVRAVMGLAGMDSQQEAEQAKQIFGTALHDYPINDFQLLNDIVIALASGTKKPDAVALISGTGSNCYAQNAEGQHIKVGGMDYLLTDQGSGYEIGRYVLRSAVKSYDGRIEKSVLEQLVCEHFHIASIGELKAKVYNPPLNKTEVAELAMLCSTAFAQGDEVAREIFDHVIDELFLMVSTAIIRLGMTNRGVDCVLVGSITKIEYVATRLEEKLKNVCPQIHVLHPEQQPVYGALRLAVQQTTG
jgi:N-acetylglucosamine kinase